MSTYIYRHTQRTVTARLIRRAPCAFQQAKINMLFDYLFFKILFLAPWLFPLLYTHNYTNFTLTAFYTLLFLGLAALMASGVSLTVVAGATSFTSLTYPIFMSYANDMDISPIYTIPWVMACMLAYFAVGLRAAIATSILLFVYLGWVAYAKIHHIPGLLAPTYGDADKYLAMPFLMFGYMLVIIRVWGVYYRNIRLLEQRMTLQKQQQHAALISQNLTKQFMLVKGLSRSGNQEYEEGNLEMLGDRFTEIEKQCDTAIHLLDPDQPR
ncbi:hypothetical protein ACWKWU_20320 [Chitinophaga lutea]